MCLVTPFAKLLLKQNSLVNGSAPNCVKQSERFHFIFKYLSVENVKHESGLFCGCKSASVWAAVISAGELLLLWQSLVVMSVWWFFSGWNSVSAPSPGHDHHRALGGPVSGLPADPQHHVHHYGPENHELWRWGFNDQTSVCYYDIGEVVLFSPSVNSCLVVFRVWYGGHSLTGGWLFSQ